MHMDMHTQMYDHDQLGVHDIMAPKEANSQSSCKGLYIKFLDLPTGSMLF